MPPNLAPSADDRVREIERDLRIALGLIRSRSAPDRRLARAQLADLQAEAIATSDHAAALIRRAMTAAGHAATALNADEQGDAA